MITEKEQNATLLSPTNKDYYTIWSELLDTAGKLSERWIPESTNEGDPGVVLLKVLTACADKLNYNIDKNILEAYMPSAAQSESMRKLCSMMGYQMKYYQSATTTVTVSYISDASNFTSNANYSGELVLPAGTVFSDIDNSISYVSLSDLTFNARNTSQTVTCIEGTLNTCEEDNNGVVSISNIDDDYRYYFPVANVAENGIYIYNISEDSSILSDPWEEKDNLNAEALGKKYFSFGYDSKQQLPYIQFPEDISSLIEDGLYIQYIATNGVNGNISAKTISTFTIPDGWDSTETSTNNSTGLTHTVDEFSVLNAAAATNGADKESINDAYQNFQKTVGTFDTLVTCRDYINKIYEMTVSDSDTNNLVSNVVVSDIRDDINKSITICSFNEYGINYVDTPLTYTADREVTISYEEEGSTKTQTGTFKETYNALDNFQLILYPFKQVYGINDKTEYVNSFTYNSTNYTDICDNLQDSKTISHEIILPETSNSSYEGIPDIVAIKNYLKLNAKITTTQKVNSTEYAYILNNIKKALYGNFNARKVDFGEEISFDNILETIEGADSRIKNVSLDNPILVTKFELANGTEYYVGDTTDITTMYKNTPNSTIMAWKIYNKLALRNILAGRVALFNYNTEFTPSITESNASIYQKTSASQLKYMTSALTISNVPATQSSTTDIKLKDNQIIQFRAPNFKTVVTYPAYVNYYLSIGNGAATTKAAVPATFQYLYNFMTDNNGANFKAFMDYTYSTATPDVVTTSAEFSTYASFYKYGFTRASVNNKYVYTAVDTWSTSYTSLYIFKLNTEINFAKLTAWLQTVATPYSTETVPACYTGLYKSLGVDQTRTIGKMIDANKIKYQLCTTYTASTSPFTYYFVQEAHASDNLPETTGATEPYYTKDGFGRDATYKDIAANEEYKLQSGEYLCINYTNSTTSVDTADSGDNTIATDATVVNTYYGEGTIIRPNVALIASSSKRASGTAYSKTSGYDFSAYTTNTIPGMYSLGTDEQIEIRKQVKTFIFDNTTDTGAVNIYFKKNNEATDGQVVLVASGDSYLLQEGEYFWYTNKDKTTLNYFGSGNVIVNKTGAAIQKSGDSTTVEDMLEYGTDAIPWITLTGLQVSDTSNPGGATTDRFIEVDEYQYLTLTASDSLCKATIDEYESEEAQLLSPTWKPVKDVVYICDGVEDTLTSFGIANITWQGRTKLAINAGPSSAQELHSGSYYSDSTITNPATCTEKIYLFNDTPTDYYPDEVTSPCIAILAADSSHNALKTNYTINSSADLIQTFYDLDGNENDVDDFMVKYFKDTTIRVKENLTNPTALTLGNMSTYYTSFTFSEGIQNKKYSTFHCTIPNSASQYLLLMIYYITTSTELSDYAYIKTTSGTPVIFNNGTTESWWANYTSSNKYYLKPNTPNVIKLTTSCDIELYCGEKTGDSIILSPLRLVDVNATKYNQTTSSASSTKIFTETSDFGINTDLLSYFGIPVTDPTTKVTTILNPARQLLNDINVKDPNHTFFYNAVIDSSVELNINTLAEPAETLATENVWYDYNNVNNKFVISEIDADYLDTGIALAKSSSKLI